MFIILIDSYNLHLLLDDFLWVKSTATTEPNTGANPSSGGNNPSSGSGSGTSTWKRT